MTSQPELHDRLARAIELARTGEKPRARQLLEEVIQADQYNELAWMWMAAVVATDGERREALEIVLEINPQNARARAALDRLGGPRARRKAELSRALAERVGGEAGDEAEFQAVVERPPEPPPAAEPKPSPEEIEAERTRRLLEIAQEEQRRTARQAAEARPTVSYYDFAAERRRRALDRVLAIAPTVLLMLVGAALVAVLILAAGELVRPLPPPPTETPQLATALALLATPTETPNPIRLVTRPANEALVLPPTWTPSHTPSPTATFTPSPTPLPPDRYRLIFSRRGPEETTYSLYTVRGDGSDEQRLTDGRGDDRYPAPAPDNQRVLIVTNARGGRELALDTITLPTSLPGSTTIPPAAQTVITSLGGTRTGSPSWASDGYRIVFSSDYDGDEDLYIINVDGSGLVPLTANDGIQDRDPAWSPDGAWIVFASDRDGPGEFELYRIRPNATDLTRLTDSAGSSYQPAWSADGQFIVFVSDRDRDADLYIMSADGTNERLLTRNDGDAEDRSPAWSPDGRWIAFSSNRDGSDFQIYLIEPGGETLTRVTTGAGDDVDAAWLRQIAGP